jgi:hypothetical protein
VGGRAGFRAPVKRSEKHHGANPVRLRSAEISNVVGHDEIGLAGHRKLQINSSPGSRSAGRKRNRMACCDPIRQNISTMLSTTQLASPSRPASRLATASYSRISATDTLGCQRGSSCRWNDDVRLFPELRIGPSRVRIVFNPAANLPIAQRTNTLPIGARLNRRSASTFLCHTDLPPPV